MREHLASQPALLKLPVQHSAAFASYCTAQHRVTPLLLPVPQSLILQVAWLNARDSFTQPSSTDHFTVTARCFSTCASLLRIRLSQHLLDLSPHASTDARSDVEQLSPEAQAVAVAYAAAPVDIQQRVRSILSGETPTSAATATSTDVSIPSGSGGLTDYDDRKVKELFGLTAERREWFSAASLLDKGSRRAHARHPTQPGLLAVFQLPFTYSSL